MDVEISELDGCYIVRVSGRIDGSTSGDFETALLQQIGNGRVALDLSGVPFMSSAGLRVVLMGAKAARAAGGNLTIFGTVAAVRTVFDVSGFNRVVTVVEGQDEAVARTRRTS